MSRFSDLVETLAFSDTSSGASKSRAVIQTDDVCYITKNFAIWVVQILAALQYSGDD